jgi:hypothetical protein
MEGMIKEHRTTWATKCLLGLLLLLLLPLIYFLSSGPMAVLLGDGEQGMAAWNTIYRPAGLLSESTGTQGLYLRLRRLVDETQPPPS